MKHYFCALGVWLCLAAGCGDVNNGSDASNIDAPSGNDGSVIDSNPLLPDADQTPDADPASPDADPNACTGEGTPCGPVTMCDPNFGTCGGFADACAETGTQSRMCVDYTCVSGQCTEGTPYQETQSCNRVTEGDTCNTPTTTCGTCGGFSDTCAENGTQTCTTTSFMCTGGTCQSSSANSSQPCTRSTQGDTCNTPTTTCGTCGGFTSTCDEQGSQTCTTTNFTCNGGSCQGTDTTGTQACFRVTDGTTCMSPTTSCGTCGNFSDSCDETGTRTCTTTTHACSSGSCQTSGSSNSTQNCTRNSDGNLCPGSDPTGCGPNQFRLLCCTNGQCGTPCGDCVGL